MKVIITSPSLDPEKNVSGISAVTRFILRNNNKHKYILFELGRKDRERGGVFRIRSLLHCLSSWKELLKKEKEAVIHYNFPLSKASLFRDPLFMYIALRRKRVIIVHIHGGLFLTHYGKAGFPYKWILRKVFRWDIPFIVLGDGEKTFIENTFGTKQIYTLPNCIDLENAQSFHRTYNTDKPLVLGYIGRISESKGMEYLLQACRALKGKQIPFVVKLAGIEDIGHKFLSFFDSYLGARFHYAGIVSGARKDEFLQSLDVFVLPSFFEGLPMSLLECMSFGIVPVTTPVGSICDVITPEENGLIIGIRDRDSLVNAILRLHTDRNLLQRLGMQAKATIFQRFNPRQYIDDLNQIYACRPTPED